MSSRVSHPSVDENIDTLLNEVFASTPLLFVKEFLRTHKKHSKHIRIGVTQREVRSNLRDAIIGKMIGRVEVERWLQEVEGWGRQHLYLSLVRKRSLTHPHLLNTAGLRSFLKKRGFFGATAAAEEPSSSHVLTHTEVDDELARITWRSHAIDFERREELDELRELDDGEYEFRAYRRNPRRSASRLIVRKADGIVMFLVDQPLGGEHDAVREQIKHVATSVLAPLVIEPIHLSPIVSALDAGAVAAFGPKPKRELTLGVAPTQARYRTDGARLEFRSTRESSGYTDSGPVRHVRKAMQIEKFEGEAGKFRLTFRGAHREAHDMIVSLTASENRVFLFSRMSEAEVLGLVDQFMLLRGSLV